MRIIESSRDYHKRREIEKSKTKCPECGQVGNLGTYHYENESFWGLKGKRKKVTTYHCLCGCKYAIEY